MSIATYAELQTAIASYLGRPGDVNISTPAPDFVALAESRIAYGGDQPFVSRALRIRAMETTAALPTGPARNGGVSGGTVNAQTVTLAEAPIFVPGLTIGFTAGPSNSGHATLNANGSGDVAIKKSVPQTDLVAGDLIAGAGYTVYYDGAVYNLVPSGGVPLPTGFLQMKSLFLQGSPMRSLSPVTPEIYNSTYQSVQAARPAAYVLEGDCIRFGPVPDAAYVAVMLFYRKFPPLSAAPNWLIVNKPDIYLWATLLEAAIYLGDSDGAERYFGLYRAALEGVQNADAADRYSGSVLQLRSGILGA
jgi:hypothetical protein